MSWQVAPAAGGLDLPYVATRGHVQHRLRSPQTLSIRPTGGQNLWARTHGAG